jgi:hypothetical protein
MAEPIEITPGVYTKPGKPEMTGLCILLDNQDAQWEVTTSDNYTTIIKIKSDSKWNVEEYTDPTTGKRKLQIFRESAKLNSLALKHFIQPTEEMYTPNNNAANNEGSELKIFYTTPDDSETPPIKLLSL